MFTENIDDVLNLLDFGFQDGTNAGPRADLRLTHKVRAVKTLKRKLFEF